MIGVPTLFDALGRNPGFQKADLSCLRATFSGADTLPRAVKERFEKIVKEQGGNMPAPRRIRPYGSGDGHHGYSL